MSLYVSVGRENLGDIGGLFGDYKWPVLCLGKSREIYSSVLEVVWVC